MNSENEVKRQTEQFYDIIYSEHETRIDDAFAFAEQHPDFIMTPFINL